MAMYKRALHVSKKRKGFNTLISASATPSRLGASNDGLWVASA